MKKRPRSKISDVEVHIKVMCSYFLRGGSGESLGATPRATDARNSCLFCCTRRAALIILWHGVLKYGRLTFCARSSTTISRSVCGREKRGLWMETEIIVFTTKPLNRPLRPFWSLKTKWTCAIFLHVLVLFFVLLALGLDLCVLLNAEVSRCHWKGF